jgi:uncharacterized OB-fold protein
VASVLVQFEGATTVMLHRLLDIKDLSRVSIGGRVKAVIKPKAKRTGSILDIDVLDWWSVNFRWNNIKL